MITILSEIESSGGETFFYELQVPSFFCELQFRENLQKEPSGGNKKRFERNNLFKHGEKSSDYWNLDSCKGKISRIGRTSLKSVKPVVDDHLDDFTKVNGKPMHVKPGSQHNNNIKGGEVVAGAILGIGSKGYTDSQRKAPPHKHEKQVGPVANKKQKPNDLVEKRKDLWCCLSACSQVTSNHQNNGMIA